MFEYFFRRSYLLFALVGLFIVFGIAGLKNTPKNLFPDSERPQAIIITQIPGASAQLAASTVSKPIEEEMARLSLTRQISSTSMSGYSIVKVEFEYNKGLSGAIQDVSNALSVVRPKLPENASPAVYSAGSFTQPVEVIALSPKKGSSLTLSQIRSLADGLIKPKLLATGNFGNVEVFGGHKSAFKIEIDPNKITAYGLKTDAVIAALAAVDKDTPLGFSKSSKSFMTITYYGEKTDITALRALYVAPNIHLGDIAQVSWSEEERFSGFMGDGKNAIALAIERSPGGSVLSVSNAAREQLSKLQGIYPNIDFQIVDTQRNLIETANTNMLEALRDAIIFTLIVLLFFLGNLRAVLAAGLSIPLVFFGTIGIIYLTGGELNIVIYTAIILALGMLVDDAVVVLENIERHLEKAENLSDAIQNGTREVLAPVFAGTVATIAIIAPLMFVGDFPQTIYRPLISTLIIALVLSYILSITFIPKLSFYLYRNGHNKNRFELFFERFYEKSLAKLMPVYLSALTFTHKSALRKIIVTISMVIFLVMSMKTVMPLIGKDTMPPMDTGIIKASIALSPNETTSSAEAKLKPFLAWLHTQPEVISSAVSFGSEPGVLSLGSGNLPTEATITINCINRFERKLSIWQIEEEIRHHLREIPGISKADVFDFGATAISTIKAPLDVRLSADDPSLLPLAAHDVKKRLMNITGLNSVSQSWDANQAEVELSINTNKALSYGITPLGIFTQLPLSGRIIGYASNLTSLSAQPLQIYIDASHRGDAQNLSTLMISTPKGMVPLGEIAQIKTRLTSSKIERTNMRYTLDINGYRAKKAATLLTDDANKQLEGLTLKGITISQEGDIAQLNDSLGRMLKAVGMGLALLFVALIAIYESVRLSAVMILTLPFAMIGAAWGMLLFDKPSCMPSMLGILLLFGILIKNSILLIDFYKEKRHTHPPFESAMESVRLRFRPVMMTAFGTIAGMLPIAFEWAVGLERLSPLADVAIGGLIVGTLLTLFFVPMMAYSVDKEKK